jgi:hypothetical protein
MQTLHQVAQLTDSALSHAISVHCDANEWPASDIQHAQDELYDAIMNGELWDENCIGYRQNMFVEWEAIMLDREDDKEARMNDAMYTNIKAHCKQEVEHDPDLYCGKYCESEY